MDFSSSRRATALLLSSVALLVSAPIACGSSDDNAAPSDGGTDGTASGDGQAGDGAPPGDDGGGGDASLDAPEPTIVVHGNGRFSCASKGGVLRCWGANDYGQLGVGMPWDTNPHPTPAAAIGMTSVDKIFGLGFYSACAMNGSTLSCWGENQFGELGHDPSLDLDAGEGGSPSTCGGASCRTSPSDVSGISGVTHVALGDQHTCAITSGGGVSCWGWDASGQLGSDAGAYSPTPTPVGALSNVVELGLGFFSSCALLQDGTVRCWGGNQEGLLGVDTSDAGPDGSGTDNGYHVAPMQVGGVSGATHLVMGVQHACVIVAGGAVMCWGANGNGQLGHPGNLDPACTLAEPCRTSAQQVAGLTDVKELALGLEKSCALKKDETVWCWGYNGTGELGRGDASPGINDPVPQKVAGLTGVAHISGGYNHTCAVKHDDSVYCWGANQHGELGVDPHDGGPGGGPLFQTPYVTRVNGL